MVFGGIKSPRIIPFMYQKTVAKPFKANFFTLSLYDGGEAGCFHCFDSLKVSACSISFMYLFYIVRIRFIGYYEFIILWKELLYVRVYYMSVSYYYTDGQVTNVPENNKDWLPKNQLTAGDKELMAK